MLAVLELFLQTFAFTGFVAKLHYVTAWANWTTRGSAAENLANVRSVTHQRLALVVESFFGFAILVHIAGLVFLL